MKNKLISIGIAILIAFGLWMYVITEVSPNSEWTYYDVPVKLEGETVLKERQLIITGISDTSVDLTLSGNRSDLNQLNSANITLKADMTKERTLIGSAAAEAAPEKSGKKRFELDEFGFGTFGLAVVLGILLGSIKIPLSGEGFSGPCFSLGMTGGPLLMGLILAHFGHIGPISLKVEEHALKSFREFGLMLFLVGAGVEGGVELVEQIANSQYGIMIVVYGFIAGALMTLIPMIVGYLFARKICKLPLLNNLGSITGGMTSTPALGTLIGVAGTDDVAAAYASTYPIALVLIVLASQLINSLMLG